MTDHPHEVVPAYDSCADQMEGGLYEHDPDTCWWCRFEALKKSPNPSLPELFTLAEEWSVGNVERIREAIKSQPPINPEDVSCVKYLESLQATPDGGAPQAKSD